MSSLLDKISNEEYEMLDNYRCWYGWSETYNGRLQPIRAVLKEWADKKETLYQLFGNNLIITKEFNYEKDREELITEMSKLVNNSGGGFGRANRKGYDFINYFRNWVTEHYPIREAECDYETGNYIYNGWTQEDKELNDKNIKIKNGLYELVTYHALADNVYSGENFTIEFADGKKYVISRGCKPMKALSKIVQSYGLPYFEDFRICHSQIHNQRKVTGTITLSIHPLDYWTMSDNECDWDSCMSWQGEGGYRQGTVEMMNSPSVIVAYLNASTPMIIGGNDKYKWSNKKWRELFIVDQDVILGIKDYPYHNTQLNIFVAKWLKELAETNMDWHYMNKDIIQFDDDRVERFKNEKYPDDIDFTISFCSGNMYTDVGALDWHSMFLGEDLSPSQPPKGECMCVYNTNKYNYNYSGAAECMCCGDLHPEIEDESCLACCDCEDGSRCEFCGDRSSEHYNVDGMCICSYCYDERTSECDYCEEQHLTDDMNIINIFPRLTPEFQAKKLKQLDPHGELKPECQCEYISSTFEIRLCDECYNKFIDKCIKEGVKLHRFEMYWDNYVGFYLDELTDEGLSFMPVELIADFKAEKPIEYIIDEHFFECDAKAVIEVRSFN